MKQTLSFAELAAATSQLLAAVQAGSTLEDALQIVTDAVDAPSPVVAWKNIANRNALPLDLAAAVAGDVSAFGPVYARSIECISQTRWIPGIVRVVEWLERSRRLDEAQNLTGLDAHSTRLHVHAIHALGHLIGLGIPLCQGLRDVAIWVGDSQVKATLENVGERAALDGQASLADLFDEAGWPTACLSVLRAGERFGCVDATIVDWVLSLLGQEQPEDQARLVPGLRLAIEVVETAAGASIDEPAARGMNFLRAHTLLGILETSMRTALAVNAMHADP